MGVYIWNIHQPEWLQQDRKINFCCAKPFVVAA